MSVSEWNDNKNKQWDFIINKPWENEKWEWDHMISFLSTNLLRWNINIKH